MADRGTADEHLAWCKRRAVEYVEEGSLFYAVTSMLSDLNKHDGTRKATFSSGDGIDRAVAKDAAGVLAWIEAIKVPPEARP